MTALGGPELYYDWIRDFTEIALALTILVLRKPTKITEEEREFPATTLSSRIIYRDFRAAEDKRF
jgi:hypothetical protein